MRETSRNARLLLASFVLLLSASFLAQFAFGYIPGYEVDHAWFRNDPYSAGNVTVTIWYHHDGEDVMSVFLFNPHGVLVKTWVVSGHQGYLYFATSSSGGTWYLNCTMLGVEVHEDSAFQLFNIPDDEGNLGSDWARHPQDAGIVTMALSIVGNTDSSHEAGHLIQNHVFTHSGGSENGFRTDLALLNDYYTLGYYSGICYSQAVIVTSYARAVGIPARVVKIEMFWPGDPDLGKYDPGPTTWFHIFAELKVFNGSCYEWIPVCGDHGYGWYGWTECNNFLSETWPASNNNTILSVRIITQINGPFQYVDVSRPNWQDLYHNDW